MAADPAPDDGELRSDLAFPYRLWRASDAGGVALILLHGSGVDETTMLALASHIAPHSLRIAVRGRVPQEDGWRWFRRVTPTSFDQRSIVHEAGAFDAFVRDLIALRGLDVDRIVFLGYSNGANLITSTMLLHPGLIRRAALLRAMPVLENLPQIDLSNTRLLVITGERDVTYAPYGPALVDLLRQRGADVESRTISAGHEFGAEDAAIVRDWLGELSI